MANTTERSVYFFRAEGTGSDGAPQQFDPSAVFTHLKSLPFTDQGLYRENDDGSKHAVWVDKLTPNVAVRYGVVRHTGLPTVERTGKLLPLPIAANDGLCEPIHVVFFDNDIVGAEFNFHGPRLTKLAEYVREKAKAVVPDHLRFGMLLKKDPIGFLDQVSPLKLLDLKIKASAVAEAKKVGGMNPFAAVEALENFGQADTIEVLLRASRKKDVGLAGTVQDFIRRMVTKKKLDLTEAFSISGPSTETGRTVTFDLLAEHLIAKKQMVSLDGRSRAIASDSAYLKIREAYKELKDELEKAPSA